MSLEKYFQKAKKQKWAIGQFNFSTLEQLKGVVGAANSLKAPIILGTSEKESGFLGLETAVALRNVFREKTGLPIFLNLDHGKSLEYLKKCCELGYDMVHFDGSELSLEENIRKTKEAVKYARKQKVLVEGEIGIFATKASKIYKEKIDVKESYLTNPDEAGKYLKETGVDCLAISVGTSHGIGAEKESIQLERLKEISQRAKNAFLVLHGGSGVLDTDVKNTVNLGITKININTDIRLVFTSALREVLIKNPEEIIPYKYLPSAIEAVEKVVGEKIKLFGGDNRI